MMIMMCLIGRGAPETGLAATTINATIMNTPTHASSSFLPAIAEHPQAASPLAN
jgi:hypothetical protein